MAVNTDHKACIMCIYYEERSGFCRRFPPKPLVVPDTYGTHIMSAFPKIPAPNLDWCSEFKNINDRQIV